MKKRKLKGFVLPTLIMLLAIVLFMGTMSIFSSIDNDEVIEDINYVSSIIWSNETPVIAEEKVIIKPYIEEKVTIAKYYYDHSDNTDTQQNSIIFYEDTYMQNSGIDYIFDKVFDVIAIYDGTVTKIEDNDLVGKTIEIKHENNVISVYQGLSEIVVKEGQVITQKTLIGKSGASRINKELGNHLHFELYVSGQVVDPLDCLNKKISDL